MSSTWSSRHFNQIVFPFSEQTGKTFANYYPLANAETIQALQALACGEVNASAQTYLWGPSGCGKTHLLQAVYHQAEKQRMSCAYIPLSEYVRHSAQDSSYFALDGLKQIDILCLDHLDDLAGHIHWQKTVFNLINELRQSKDESVPQSLYRTQPILLLAGRYPPSNMPLEFSDLTSRLAWGNVHSLNPLSDEGKLQALEYVLNFRQIDCPTSSLHYLFNHYTRDFAELLDLIQHLGDCAQREKNQLTIPFIKQTLTASVRSKIY